MKVELGSGGYEIQSARQIHRVEGYAHWRGLRPALLAWLRGLLRFPCSVDHLLNEPVTDLRDVPFGGPEARMAGDSPSMGAGKRPRQGDRIAFHNQIKIRAGAFQKQIPDESTDNIQRSALLVGCLSDRLEQRQTSRQEGGRQAILQVAQTRDFRFLCQGLDQIGTGYDADDLVAGRFPHRDLAPTCIDHHVLQMLD